MNSFKDTIFGWFLNVIGLFDIYVAEAQAVLTTDLFSGPVYDSMLTISGCLKPICLSILTICFLVQFLKITMKMDILKWEYGLKIFAMLCISQAAIDIAPKLLAAIYATVVEWIDRVVSNGTLTSMSNAATNGLSVLFEEMTFWDSLAMTCTMFLMALVIFLCGLMIKVMAYARMFEIFIYLAVSPIPCAFLPMEDSGSRVVRQYFFSFAAVCLQGLMMIIIMGLFDSLIGASITSAIANTTQTGVDGIASICFNMLLGSLVLTVAVTKSGSWAKQILGVC